MKKTIVIRVDSQAPEIERVRRASEFIRRGGLVSFPTETVYGLGADALNPSAVRSLYHAKDRPFDNPPILHIGYPQDVGILAAEVPVKAEKLMRKYWPGPLTLIFKRSEIIPDITVASLDTVAVRMPRHAVALALIRESRRTIAAPSANLAGRPSPTSAEHVLSDLNGRIDAVLDAGPTAIGVESTVLDITVDPPQILRPGGISYEVLKRALRRVDIHPEAIATSPVPIEKARSPGQIHKHYAPNADLMIVEGDVTSMVAKIRDLTQCLSRNGKKIGVLATDETVGFYEADAVKSLGSRKDLANVAANLFALLRQFDSEAIEVIVAEGLPSKGLGLAIMNRLRKASGYRIVRA